MVKCKVFIDNEEIVYNEVFIIAELPIVPRVGETIWLTNPQLRELEKKASKSKHKNYYIFYSSGEMNFEDHIHVAAVVHNCYDPEYVYVALSDDRGSSRDVYEEINEIKNGI
tara:strand:+ start:4819 stop:5154 length:336 start_codon:yes stop_codon:yes gene_type:complete